MTKEYRRVKKEVTREIIAKITCDWCGERIMEPGVYRERRFDLVCAKGHSYPGGGDMTGWQVEDLCDECQDKLRDLLEKAGIKISSYFVDW